MVPVENAWALLKSKVRARQATNIPDLWQYFEKLAYSFPTSCKLIVEAKGHATKY